MKTTLVITAAVVGASVALSLGAVTFAAVTGRSDTGLSTEEVARELQESAPAGQQAALADRSITMDEYTAAAGLTASCVEAAGGRVSIVPGSDAAPPSFTFSAATIEEGERTRSLLESCKAQHLAGVQTLWNAAHRATEAQSEASYAWLAACVNHAGQSVSPVGVTGEVIVSWINSSDLALRLASSVCFDEHYRAFGYWP